MKQARQTVGSGGVCGAPESTWLIFRGQLLLGFWRSLPCKKRGVVLLDILTLLKGSEKSVFSYEISRCLHVGQLFKTKQNKKLV